MGIEDFDETSGADLQRRVNEMRQRAARIHYGATRHRLWFPILIAARDGALTAQWRDELKTKRLYGAQFAGPTDTALTDGDELAVHELTTMPVEDWGLYATGGDWRAALNAWYSASTDLIDRLDNARSVNIDVDRRNNPALAPFVAKVRRESDAYWTRYRDWLGAWYRGGLAAGGEDVDWREWYRDRIHDWDRNAGRDTALQNLDNPNLQRRFVSLPDYWTQASP